MSEKFSLKDFLFNRERVAKNAAEITKVYPAFRKDDYVEAVVSAFPHLELKQRIAWIREKLHEYLPQDYRKAVRILLDSLPPPNDASKTDDDFGDFIHAPYNDFVAFYGRNKKDLAFSLAAIKEITMRFSAEDAIRYFINEYPKETLIELKKWSTDPHYHVRRLVSEGTRPKLPWAQKISLSVDAPLPLLDNLFSDSTRFVTRSVANHLNDISKIAPELVLERLDRWQKSERQHPKEMEFIIKHALRTLVKKGNKRAIEFLNFSSEPAVTVSSIQLSSDTVKMGSALEFRFTITAQKDERLVVDYVIYFQSKNGKGVNSKVFKIKQLDLKKDQTVAIEKRHKLLEKMTTRTLYPGKHIVEIQINGMKSGQKEFILV